MKKRTATMFLLTASLIWGISFVVMKNLLNDINVNRLLAYRFTVAALGLLFVPFVYRKEFTKRSWFHGFLIGLCMYSAFVFQTYGLLFIGSGKNALITAVYVVLVPFLMWILKKKRPSMRSVIAGITCFLGIAVLSIGEVSRSNASQSAPVIIEKLFGFIPTDTQMEIIGVVLTLISGVLYGLHIAIVNIFGDETHVMPLTFMQYLFAAAFAWIVSIIFEPAGRLFELFPKLWVSLLYVSLLSTLIAFTFQNIGVKNAPPAFASIILCLESLFGCIFSIIFTSEQLTVNIAVGAIIIIGSVIISELKLPKSKKEEALKDSNI